MEVPPRMRPATHVRHPDVGFDEVGVRLVAIRLQQPPETGPSGRPCWPAADPAPRR
jgi:hypothetical protein